MLFEELLIFPAPRYPQGDWEPEEIKYEEAYFESEDGVRLHGWFMSHPNPRAHVLYCHGNGEHVAYVAGFLDALREQLELTVFAFDYRGYGRSGGKPDEAGVLADGRAAQEWLAERTGVPKDSLVLMGRSLGGAVAIDLAATVGARGLVVENTFTQLPDVAARLFWWAPVRWLVRTQLKSIEKIANYRGPLLVSHAAKDTLVPIELGRRLFEAAPSKSKRFFEVPDADHNDPQPDEYYVELVRFLDALPR